MAIYSCNISNISRAKGYNACRALAYITGLNVYCERTGYTYNYGNKERVFTHKCHLPQNANSKYNDEIKLINAAENKDKAKNAKVAEKIILALPKEFKIDEHKKIVDEFCEYFTAQGFPCVSAIHYDELGKNPHAHIIVVNRPIKKDGEFGAKSKKEYVLDENGNRVPLIDKKTGKQKLGKRNEKIWKRVDVEINPLSSKSHFREVREHWANVCNKYLDTDHQISHKSYKEQGIGLLPTMHEGAAARAAYERGEIVEICELNNDIKRLNAMSYEELYALNKKDFGAKQTDWILELDDEEYNRIIDNFSVNGFLQTFAENAAKITTKIKDTAKTIWSKIKPAPAKQQEQEQEIQQEQPAQPAETPFAKELELLNTRQKIKELESKLKTDDFMAFMYDEVELELTRTKLEELEEEIAAKNHKSKILLPQKHCKIIETFEEEVEKLDIDNLTADNAQAILAYNQLNSIHNDILNQGLIDYVDSSATGKMARAAAKIPAIQQELNRRAALGRERTHTRSR